MDYGPKDVDLAGLKPVFYAERGTPSLAGFLHSSDLNTGDLLFFSGEDAESSVVVAASASPWSHVGMVLKATARTVKTFSEFAAKVPSNWRTWASKMLKLYDLERVTGGAGAGAGEVPSAVVAHFAELAVALSMLRNSVHVVKAISEESTSHWRTSVRSARQEEPKEVFLWESTTADDLAAECFVTGNREPGPKLTLLRARVEGYEGIVGRRALLAKSVGSARKTAASPTVTTTTSTTATTTATVASTASVAAAVTKRRYSWQEIGKRTDRGDVLSRSSVPSSISSSSSSSLEDEADAAKRERASLTKTSPAVLEGATEGSRKLARKNTTLEIKRIVSARNRPDKNPAKIELRSHYVLFSVFANILVNLGKPYERELANLASSCCYDDCGEFEECGGPFSFAYYLFCCFLCRSCRDAEFHDGSEYDSLYCSELIAQTLKDLCVGDMLMLYDPSSKGTMVKSARGEGWEQVDVQSLTQTDASKSSPNTSPRVANLLLSDPFQEGAENEVGLSDLASLYADPMSFVDYAQAGKKGTSRDDFYHAQSKDWISRKLNVFYLLEGMPNRGEENYVLVHQLVRLLLHSDESVLRRKTDGEYGTVSNFLRERTDLSPKHLATVHELPFAMSGLKTHPGIKMRIPSEL